MDNVKNEEAEIDLLQLAAVLWQNIIAIILAALIFGGAAYGATRAFVTPLYNSRAYMYVNSSNISLGGAKLSISSSELTAAKSLVDTYIVILNTRLTLEEVIERANVNYTYDQLKRMISASSVNGTEIFYIDVTSPDSAEAELLANTIAQVLPDKISSVVDGSSVRIVDYAVRATTRKSPSYTGNAVKAALAGAVLAVGLFTLLFLMDEQIHDTDYLTKNYDIPVLANIPDLLAKQGGTYYYYQNSEKASDKQKK